MAESIVLKTLNLCKKYYNTDIFLHAVNVANYAISNPIAKFLTSDVSTHTTKDDIYCFALCHDLFEDTECTVEEISEAVNYDIEFVASVLKPLTKDDDTVYINYILDLYENKYNAEPIVHLLSYLIKLSDMKDHLTEKATLTSYLKNKYDEALPYLL